MKKLIAILALSLAFAGALFAEIPAFSDEKAFLIDSTTIPGTMKDNVKITNGSMSAANFDVTIFAYDEDANGWIVFGKGHLKSLGDIATIKSMNKKLIKLANYKYFALKTSADNPFVYTVVKDKNDLNVWIYDDREIDKSHFKLFDLTMLPSFSDNLKVVGGDTLRAASLFEIQVYNDEAEEEKSGTYVIVRGKKSTENFKTTAKGQKYGDFHYLKIISLEEKDFKYTINVASNDLIVTINN